MRTFSSGKSAIFSNSHRNCPVRQHEQAAIILILVLPPIAAVTEPSFQHRRQRKKPSPDGAGNAQGRRQRQTTRWWPRDPLRREGQSCFILSAGGGGGTDADWARRGGQGEPCDAVGDQGQGARRWRRPRCVPAADVDRGKGTGSSSAAELWAPPE